MSGFPSLPSGLDRLAEKLPDPEPPSLIPARGAPVQRSGAGRTRLQRTPVVSREGRALGRRPVTGVSPEEKRAAQDVPGSLAERILVKLLRDQDEQFEYRNDPNTPDTLGVTALVHSRVPPVAIDVIAERSRSSDPGMENLPALLAGLGYRYAAIAGRALLESAESAEAAVEAALGRNTGVNPLALREEEQAL